MKTQIQTLMIAISSLSIFAIQAHAATIAPIRAEQVPSGMPYKIQQPVVESPNLFSGKRVAILASHGVEESELAFPYVYLKRRGAQVDILVPNWTPEGITVSRFLKPVSWVTPDGTFQSKLNQRYDLVILTGGAWNSQVVKSDNDALKLVVQHYRSGGALAATCAGTEVLIISGISRGVDLTGPSYARLNLINSGSTFHDQPSVLSGRLLTSRDPNDLVHFVNGLKRQLIGR